MHTCPLCKSKTTAKILTSHNRHGRHDIDTNDTFTLMQCSTCRLVFLADITIDEAYYKKYYDTGYYESRATDNLISQAVTKLTHWSRQQKNKYLLKSAPKRTQALKILDVGSGDGSFLESLDEHSFEKYGIEINKEGIALSRGEKFTLYEKDITEIDFGKKKFDIITLWHVLEHLTNPRLVFKKMHEILADDGIIVFATPNTDSLGFHLGKKYWFHLDSPRHLMLFNMKTVQFVCEKTGFTIESSRNEFYDYPLDLFWSIKNSFYKYMIYPFYPIVKYFDQEALTVICRKSTSLRGTRVSE